MLRLRTLKLRRSETCIENQNGGSACWSSVGAKLQIIRRIRAVCTRQKACSHSLNVSVWYSGSVPVSSLRDWATYIRSIYLIKVPTGPMNWRIPGLQVHVEAPCVDAPHERNTSRIRGSAFWSSVVAKPLLKIRTEVQRQLKLRRSETPVENQIIRRIRALRYGTKMPDPCCQIKTRINQSINQSINIIGQLF